ncbi:MAG TPA: hypothetical protein VE093_04950 [Polyangiaceae bacterium]|nr:hypothetical protein [Polyangiaceae bacterium]
MSPAVIALIAIVLAGVFGLGGCMLCILIGSQNNPQPTAGADPQQQGAPLPATGADPASWITSERPYVKFLPPPGWNKDLKDDWGVFTSKDGAAVFAFTTFNQPGESTARLGRAAWVLGVDDIQWGVPKSTVVGSDNFKARMGEGTCRFNGPGGYIWYATVNPGTSDQILLIYTVSAVGGQAHKDAVLTSIRSLQRRP